MTLAEACYRLTKRLPRHERFEMSAQIQRAAASIPANISEGNGRENTGSYIPFLRVAQGSLKELETHILLGRRVELFVEAETSVVLADCEEVGKMLRALIRSRQSKQSQGDA